jgi:hypothetical protein
MVSVDITNIDNVVFTIKVDNTTNDYYLNCYSKLNCEDQWFETNSRIMQISNCCKSGRGESYKYKNQCYSCKVRTKIIIMTLN